MQDIVKNVHALLQHKYPACETEIGVLEHSKERGSVRLEIANAGGVEQTAAADCHHPSRTTALFWCASEHPPVPTQTHFVYCTLMLRLYAAS